MDKIPVLDCIAKDHYDLPPKIRQKILSLIAESGDPPLDDGTSFISQYDFDFSFDLITMIFVLEHLQTCSNAWVARNIRFYKVLANQEAQNLCPRPWGRFVWVGSGQVSFVFPLNFQSSSLLGLSRTPSG